MKVTVAGSERFCRGFRLAGVQDAYELSAEAFAERADDIVADTEGVLIVANGHLQALPERRRLELQNAVDPVVVPIGGDGDDTDLRSKIKQAIGVDLWSED